MHHGIHTKIVDSDLHEATFSSNDESSSSGSSFDGNEIDKLIVASENIAIKAKKHKLELMQHKREHLLKELRKEVSSPLTGAIPDRNNDTDNSDNLSSSIDDGNKYDSESNNAQHYLAPFLRKASLCSYSIINALCVSVQYSP